LSPPVLIDDTALAALGRAGHRWQEGHAAGVRYRWLLPPDGVLAGALPDGQPNGLQPVCGAGDRAGRWTAALVVVRGNSETPATLVARGASQGAEVITFQSRNGPVAERLEQDGARTTVTTAHAFTRGGELLRFLIAATGPSDPEAVTLLRTLGVALSLTDEVDETIDRLRLGGRLTG
jgi:hypothetical protein